MGVSQAMKGKRVLVTGGSSGIGKAIAQRFAEEGAQVAIFGTSAERGKAAVEEINAACGADRTLFFAIDVASFSAVQEACKQVQEALGGPVDVLVNNAGVTCDNLLLKMKEEDWDRVIDVNLKSAFNTCKALARSFIKARQGKIINISSVVGLMGNPGQVNYGASKAGLIGFTKSLARELAPRNICVNCVAPGYVETRMTDFLTEDQKKKVTDQIPLGRLGEADEIAQCVLFLAGSGGNYITGQTFVVDGGMAI